MERNFKGRCIPNNDVQNQNPSTSGQHLPSTSITNQPFNPNRHPEILLNFHQTRNPNLRPYLNQAVPPPQQTGARNLFNAVAVRGNISHSQQFRHQTSWNTHPTYSYANQQHYASVNPAQTWTQLGQSQNHQNFLVYPSHISTRQIAIPQNIGHHYLNQNPLTSEPRLASTSNPNQPFNPCQQPEVLLNFHQPRNLFNSPYPNRAISSPQQTGARNQFDVAAVRGSILHSQQFQHQISWNTCPTRFYADQQYYAALSQAQVQTQPHANQQGLYHQLDNAQINVEQNFPIDLCTRQTRPAQPATTRNLFEYQSQQQAPQHFQAEHSVHSQLTGNVFRNCNFNTAGRDINYTNTSEKHFATKEAKDAAIKQHQEEHMKNLPKSVVLYDEKLKPNQLPDVHPGMHEYEAYQGLWCPVGTEEFIPSTREKLSSPANQQAVSFNTILNLTYQNRFVALVGPPGSGKTTLSKQLAKLSQPNLSAKFLLKFMDLSYDKPLTCKQLFVDCLCPGLDDKTKECAFQWMIEHQDSCVFVLDGYDQALWTLQNMAPVNASYDTPLYIDQLVANLCGKKFFQESLLIFTSRPHSILKIPSQLRPNVTIHVDDLSTEDMEKLFCALAGDRNDELWKMVSTKTPQLFSLCHNPLLLQLIVFALSHQSLNKAKALHTITEVFEVVLEHLRRSKHARGNLDITELWEPLGKMAYEGMQEKTVIFTRKNLGNLDASIVQDVIIAFAKFEHYFSNPRLFDGDQRFYFSHQMLQEVFAAKYISEFMSDEEFCRIIPIVAKGGHWSMVRRFLCGLMLGVKDEKDVQSPSCKPASPSVQHTEKPANRQGKALQFAGPSRSMERFPPVLQQPAGMTPQLIDANSLMYRFIPRQEIHQPVAGMTSQHAGPSSSMYRFPQAVQQLAGITPQFVCSNYSMYGFSPTQTIHQHLADNSFESLYGGASAQKLDKVETFRKNLFEYMKTDVTKYDLIDLLTDLQECSDDEKDFLARHLPVKFYFIYTPISSSAAHALAEILPRLNRTVEELDLRNCNLNSDTLRVICGGINKMKHGMKELNLSDNDFGNPGVEIISGCLKKVKKRLGLADCEISAAGLEVLCGEIKHLDIPMEALDLSNNDFGNAGAEIISASGCLRKVKYLDLRDCWISDNGEQILRGELKRLGLPRSTVWFGFGDSDYEDSDEENDFFNSDEGFSDES